MTVQHRRVLWFFAIYGFSLTGFAALALLVRMLLRWIL